MPDILFITSISLASTIVLGYSLTVWYRLWRKKDSGSAHAMFMMTISMLLLVVFEVFSIVTDIATENDCFGTNHDVYVWIFIGAYTWFNFAFSRGYFIRIGDREK